MLGLLASQVWVFGTVFHGRGVSLFVPLLSFSVLIQAFPSDPVEVCTHAQFLSSLAGFHLSSFQGGITDPRRLGSADHSVLLLLFF